MKKLCIALILGAVLVSRIDAACNPFANTPGITAWSIADQIRAIAEGADNTGNDTFIIRQTDLPVSLNGATYLVVEDLFMSGTSDAITIDNPSVLDFRNHTLVQLPAVGATIRAGVRVNAAVTTIRNGSIVLNNGTPVVGSTGVRGISLEPGGFSCVIENMRIVGGLTATPNVFIGDCINFQTFRDVIRDCVLSQASRGVASDVGIFGSVVERVFVNNMSGTGFFFGGTSTNMFIENCQALNCGGNGFHFAVGAINMYLRNSIAINTVNAFRMTTTSDQVLIQSCIAMNSTTGFSSTTANPTHYVHNCVAINNTTNYAGLAPETGYSFLASLAATNTTVNWWSSLAG